VSSLDSRDLAAHSHSLTASEAKIPLVCNLFWWRSKIAIWRRNKRSENSLIPSETTLRERGLNKIRSSRLVEYVMALLLLSAVIAASATAKHKPEKVANSVTVVAHLPLSGAPGSQLLMQQHEGKQYLYIQQLSEEGFTIIDVTKPLRPNVVNRVNLANRDFREQLQMVGAGLAIAEAPDAGTSGGSNALVLAKAEGMARSRTDGSPGRSPSQFVRLLDLTDPASPRTLQTFNAVSNILLDGGRNLIYITNGEGQWILSHMWRRRIGYVIRKLRTTQSVMPINQSPMEQAGISRRYEVTHHPKTGSYTPRTKRSPSLATFCLEATS
jgi:hypothetical protein